MGEAFSAKKLPQRVLQCLAKPNGVCVLTVILTSFYIRLQIKGQVTSRWFLSLCLKCYQSDLTVFILIKIDMLLLNSINITLTCLVY